MANLPVPKSSPKLPQTIFSGDMFGAQEGRALQDVGQSVERLGGVLEERQTQREISTLNAEMTKAQAELTIQWREALATADPNDDELASRFMSERVEARLKNLSGLAKTREAKAYYQRMASGLGANFLVTTDSGQAGLAEVKAVTDFESTLNQINDSVSADPLSFDTTIPVIDIALDGFQRSGGLTSETRLKLQNDAYRSAARSAARGLIEQNPQTARELVESGKYSEYLTGEDKAQLINYADTAISAQEAARRKGLEDAASAATAEILTGAFNTDGSVNYQNLNALVAQAVQDPRLSNAPGADQQRTIINMVRGLADSADKVMRTDPATFQDIYFRATLPPSDPRRATEEEVFSAVGRGRLTSADANAILDRRKGENTEVGRVRNQLQETLFATGARYITGSDDLGLADPERALQYATFQTWAISETQRLLAKGTPLHEIYAPDGPLYSVMPQFKRSQETARDAALKQLRRGDVEAPAVQPFSFDQKTPTTYKGKDVKDLTPEELDAYLKERRQ